MSDRPLRADARRNRDRLLEVAVQAFSTDGPDVPLESIARTAGVGIGTLYRHFPSREALVEAVYRSELERLCQEGAALLAELPPEVDPCAERGEFHTCAYGGPMFAHPVPIETGITVERDGFVFTDLCVTHSESSV